MDVHTAFDAGALGFWIFIAVIVAAAIWAESRKNSERHETLRRIMEKTGMVDEAQLKLLFRQAAPSSDKPGDGYRALRVSGTIVLFIAVGIAAATLSRGLAPPEPQTSPTLTLPDGRTIPKTYFVPKAPYTPIPGLAAAGLVALFGAGLFFSSRFLEPPLPAGPPKEPPAH